MKKHFFILAGALMTYGASAQAEIACVLNTVTGPNSYAFSGHRKTQSAEIKIIQSQTGGSDAGTVTIDDIKGTVIRHEDSQLSISIVKYNTSSSLRVERVKLSGESNAKSGLLKQGSTFLLELPENDRAWIICTEK